MSTEQTTPTMNETTLPCPAFVVDQARIRRNLAKLALVKERTGCRILLALKAFALWRLAGLIRSTLDGSCASSPWEARLGREEFGGEVHAFAAAYSEADIRELLTTCDHINFNSFAQWQRFRPLVRGRVGCGLRINPQHSTQDHAIYDPCAPHSRLGIIREHFDGQDLSGISGLHFHTLCEQGADALESTLVAVEERFGDLLPQMEWLNFGGGHHITRPDYDLDLLCALINRIKEQYGVQVYLEPGEAVALNCGVLTAEVLDIVDNGVQIAILNLSCTAHMPDVLEMPYRPRIWRQQTDLFDDHEQGGQPGELPHNYRLAGLSCLAGDVIGDYAFARPLTVGDRLVFGDMAHYTMVKTTMFNGVAHPAICLIDSESESAETVRVFDYPDFKQRLS